MMSWGRFAEGPEISRRNGFWTCSLEEGRSDGSVALQRLLCVYHAYHCQQCWLNDVRKAQYDWTDLEEWTTAVASTLHPTECAEVDDFS